MLREISDKTEWDKIYSQAQVASGKFLQSREWGDFQRSLGRKVMRFAEDDCLAQVIEIPLPLGKKYWMCPKGPISDEKNQESRTNFQEFIEELKKKAKEAGAVFLRIEPPVNVIASGAKQSRAINPATTSIIDLSKIEEELLAAMHPKTRYNIKVSEKHAVKIERHVDVATIFDELSALFKATAARDGFNLHPIEYYRKQLEAFSEKKNFVPGKHSPHIVTFVARAEGKMLAAAIVMFDGDDVTYLHGASSSEMRNVMAPYALHWAIIRRAKERGYKHYDLWGVSDDPRSSWAGITRFKRGWGGAGLSAPGTFDLPINSFWYSVYRLVRRMRS